MINNNDVDKIPSFIEVRVYYTLGEDGFVLFDEDEMTEEFQNKLKELQND